MTSGRNDNDNSKEDAGGYTQVNPEPAGNTNAEAEGGGYTQVNPEPTDNTNVEADAGGYTQVNPEPTGNTNVEADAGGYTQVNPEPTGNTNVEADAGGYTQATPNALTSSPDANTSTIKAKTHEDILRDNGFVRVGNANIGAGGDCGFYKYVGSEPRFQEKFNDEMIFIKFAKNDAKQDTIITTNNEIDIIQSVFEKADRKDNETLYRPEIIVADLEGAKFIMNECVFYDKTNQLKSDLEQFVLERGSVDSDMPMNEIDGKFLDKIFTGIVNAQSKLHADFVIHLDTALRNYMMAENEQEKIIDFGLSKKIDPTTGVALNDGALRSISTPSVYYYDQASLQGLGNKEGPTGVSLRTDVFSRKIAMIEAMALYAGLPAKGRGSAVTEIFFKGMPRLEQVKHSDEARLAHYVTNLQAYVNENLADNDPRLAIINEKIQHYREYLTTMPPLQTPLLSVSRQDTANFQATNDPSQRNKRAQEAGRLSVHSQAPTIRAGANIGSKVTPTTDDQPAPKSPRHH